jgi:mannosyltransferase OCH1-like enzyme
MNPSNLHFLFFKTFQTNNADIFLFSKFKLWTAKSSREFIEKEYPWFLKTYDSYPFGVQRNDALRYFLMRHFGGIYIDLDNVRFPFRPSPPALPTLNTNIQKQGCNIPLTPLLSYPLWTTYGGHGTISNNILGARPQHPFWIFLTNALPYYAWSYPLPYITISYASGQWFMSKLWRQYHERNPQSPMVRILMDARPGAAEWVFFTGGRGGSWDNWDNHVFGWIGRTTGHLVITIFVGCTFGVGVLVLGMMGWRAVRRVQFGRRGRKEGWYQKEREGEGEEQRPFLDGDDGTELRPMR